jgi:proton glutamate symport protein
MTDGTRVLAGLGVGLAGGLAIAASHNATLLDAADAVAPVGQLWVNAIRMTVIPLVVSLVITGVASASTVGAVGRIGARTLTVFFAMLTGATILALPIGIAVFSWLSHLVAVRPELPPGAAEAAGSLRPVRRLLAFGAGCCRSFRPTRPLPPPMARCCR